MSGADSLRAAGFAGGGELGERIRGYDWAATPIGPLEEWPDSLRTAVRIMLASSQPIWIGWGEELTYLYNDPYKSIIGGKHPGMLGRPTRVVWAEIWDVIEPMLRTALTSEQGTYVESQLLIMERHGYREETYYTFSYSPIPDEDGRPRGIICVNTDDTQRRIGERQLATLNELAAKTAEGLGRAEVCRLAGEALASNGYDLPFALLYLADEQGFTLAGSSGIEPGHPAAPRSVEFDSRRAGRLRRAYGQRKIVVVDDIANVAASTLPSGEWGEPPTQVAYVPLSRPASSRGDGVLVVGLSPFRLFDAGYSDFLTLLGSQISASLGTAQAYEDERMRAEALAELDHAKTVFFSNVSHEFRTPLTLMLGPLDDAAATASGDVVEIQRDSFDALRRNTLRLLRMVNTVLDFSRVGAGEAAAVFRPTDLEELTRGVAAHFAPLLERNGIDFAVETAALPAPVYVDAEAWEKIVLNLLSNAFKFTLRGEIRVALDAVDGMARLRVADTGTGVPDEELPHLFKRFHRVRNEQARTHEGTGIGLALVQELVELHGGRVEVESLLGEGTTFSVLVPLGSEHLPVEHVHHEAGTVTSGQIALTYTEEAGRWSGIEPEGLALTDDGSPSERSQVAASRVVVVDDNADIRDYMTRLLARYWQVDTYADGQAALDGIRANPPSLVVTDVMMPRLGGFELLAALRSDPSTATIPVIVLSARAGEESSVEGLEAGADDYLVKPFSSRELIARVRANLELARVRAEAGRLAALEDVRSRVITTVSHELRTPVASIYGAARTLERADQLDERTTAQLKEVIERESERLARITNDILTTESLTSGLISFATIPVDLREPVERAFNAVRATSPDGFELHVSLPDRPVTVTADRARLQQVVTNLLDNAIKYSPDGGAVRAEVTESDGHAAVVVTDEGLGIPEDAREEIFSRFYRVDPTLTGGVGGSGLGLYIARQLVEGMGGRIGAEPNQPRGSRFVVTFPLTRTASERA